MPLSGAFPRDLARAMREEVEACGGGMEVVSRAFSEEALKREIEQGRPVLLSCLVRLPQRPQLSWGHEVAAIGWGPGRSGNFVFVRDNFYPTRFGDAVRCLPVKVFTEMIMLRPL
jgi:hypothetical protein